MAEFVICYDIAQPRRLARLHRYLKKWAAPIQYSMFLMTGDDRQLERCLAGAETIIDPGEDDLRAYMPPPAPGVMSARSPVSKGIETAHASRCALQLIGQHEAL